MVANSASSALAANATLLGTAWVNLDGMRLPIPSSALSSFKFYLLKLHADFQVTMTLTSNVYPNSTVGICGINLPSTAQLHGQVHLKQLGIWNKLDLFTRTTGRLETNQFTARE